MIALMRPSLSLLYNRVSAAWVVAAWCSLAPLTGAFAIDLPIPIEEPQRDTEVDYHSEVMPLLRRACLACHNEKIAESGLNMETVAKMLAGGDSGPALVAGDATMSLLISRSSGAEEPLMPPEDNSAGAKPLTPQELGLLSLWIRQGAKVGEAKPSDSPAWQRIPATFQPIYAIDVSPSGQYLAASRGSAVVLHEVAGLAEIGRLIDPSLPESAGGAAADIDLVQAISFSPDGSQIATGGYRSVKLWSKQNRTLDLATKPWAQGLGPLAAASESAIRAIAQADFSIRVFEGDTPEPKATLVGHGQPIVGLALKGTGETLVSVDAAGNVIVWNTQTGQPLTRIELSRAIDSLVAPASLSHFALLDGLGGIHLFQIVAGEPMTIQPHVAEATAPIQDANAIAWVDAPAPLLVVATEAGPVSILDANTGAAAKAIDAGAVVDALAVAKPSNLIATAGRDGQIKLWDSASGELKRTLRGDPRRVHGADQATRSVTRQESLLTRLAAVGEELKKRKESEDAAVVKATETRDKSTEAVKEPTQKYTDLQADLTATETKIADTTKQVESLKVKIQETTARLKVAKEGGVKAEPAPAPAAAPAEAAAPAAPVPAAPAAEAPAAPAAPAAEQPVTVQLTELVADLKKQLEAAEADLKQLETSEAELKALTASIEEKKKAVVAAKEAKDTADAELVKHQQALDAGIEARDRLVGLIGEHDGRVGGETRQAKWLTRQSQRYQRELGEHALAAVSLAFAPAGDRLATVHRDGSVRVYVGDETIARTVFEAGSLPVALTADPQAIFPDAESLVLTGLGGQSLGWELKPQWQLTRTIGNPLDPSQESPISDRVTALDFTPDGKLIAVGSGPPSRAGQLLIFSTVDGKLVRELEGVHSDTVLAVRFSPDGRLLASSAADKIIRVIDPVQGSVVRSLEGHTHHVLSLAWQDNAATLVSASADQTVKVWDAESGTQARTIPGIGKEATSIRFVGTTGQILTAGADGNVRLHESGDGKAIRSFAAAGDFLFAVAVTPDGSQVFTGGQDGILRGWKVADGAVVAEIKPQ